MALLKKCSQRCCGSCAQVCGPAAVICFLAGSSIGGFVLAQLQPVLSFLGERIHVIELLCILGWGLWIVHLGLPWLGWAFCVIAVLPGWPYALYDLLELGYTKGRGRILMALMGLHHLQEYEGPAASPEMHLIAMVLAKVPMMAVIAMASAEGRDVLVSGSHENGLLRFVTLAYAFLSGADMAGSSYACVDAVEEKEAHESHGGIEEALASQIDGWISRLNTYLVHAVDTLTVVTVVGAVGGHCSRETFAMWIFSLWMLTGLLPALAAPPPMPTLRPALPQGCGTRAWCHKLAVSLLLVASPPTEFMPLLRVSKQRVWAAACLLRAVWLLTSAMAFPTLRKPLFAGLEVIHVVVVGALGLATVAIIRLLHSEVHHHHHRKLTRLKPSSSFFSVDSSYDLHPTATLKEPLCPKIHEEPVEEQVEVPEVQEVPEVPEVQEVQEEEEDVSPWRMVHAEAAEREVLKKVATEENPQEAAQRSDSEAVKDATPASQAGRRPAASPSPPWEAVAVGECGHATSLQAAAVQMEEEPFQAGFDLPDLESQAAPNPQPRTGVPSFLGLCCPARAQDCLTCTKAEPGDKDLLT